MAETSSTLQMALRLRNGLPSYKHDEYAEQLQFEDDEEAANLASKRRRIDEIDSSDGVLDAETAWAIGFTPHSMTSEEEDLLPVGADEGVYTSVRNHVIAKWREDVSRWLSEKEAALGIRARHQVYVKVAWRFLNTCGVINFGVSRAITKNMREAPVNKPPIVVVGAGMAGLAAVRQLRAFGHPVIVVEGNRRPGGRVYTKKIEGAVGDLGGSIITGIDGNPLAVIARQLGVPMHAINSEAVPLYTSGGAEANKRLDSQVEVMYNKLLDLSDRFRDEMGDISDNVSLSTALETAWQDLPSRTGSVEERQLLDWHMANLEFANAIQLRKLSMKSWDQDDPHELLGTHAFLPGGNVQLLKALTADVDIFYDNPVTRIDYHSDGVSVHTATHTFKAAAVLVTASLGVLKRNVISFNPPLPERKQGAISRMGFGVLNKVVLLFPNRFWSADRDMFGHVADSTKERGDFFLFYSYADLAGGPLLAALASGDAAVAFEKQSGTEIVARVLRVLKAIFAPQGVTVPQPVQAVCTRWGQDPMAYGSYSSLSVGCLGGEEYDIMAENLGGRVFFAGEATTRKYPATMHGAFHTGLREAANITATLAKAEAAKMDDLRPSESVDTSENQTDHTAKEQSSVLTRAAELEALLAAAFSEPGWPPSIEFGCFAAIVGPPGSEFHGEALLRIDTGDAKGGGSRRHLPMHLQVKEDDLLMLQEIQGGDSARIDAMTGVLGIKLVNRPPLPDRVRSLVYAVLKHRGQPLPSKTNGGHASEARSEGLRKSLPSADAEKPSAAAREPSDGAAMVQSTLPMGVPHSTSVADMPAGKLSNVPEPVSVAISQRGDPHRSEAEVLQDISRQIRAVE